MCHAHAPARAPAINSGLEPFGRAFGSAVGALTGEPIGRSWRRPSRGGSRRERARDLTFKRVEGARQKGRSSRRIRNRSHTGSDLTRRSLILGSLAAPFATAAYPQSLTCGQVTERQTEGPYFKTNSPERSSLLEQRTSAPLLQ